MGSGNVVKAEHRRAAMSVATKRRIPVQRRSRARVERILRVAEQIVIRDGLDALSTRAVAARAKLPVASLYQYFADREAIIAALIERHVLAMDEQLASALGELETFSARTLVRTTVEAYVAGYRERPSYVLLWFQGRVSHDIDVFVRTRNRDLAARYHAFAIAAGIVRADTDPLVIQLVAEMIDSFLGVAYRDDIRGDERVVVEGIEMIVSYVERYATPQGIAGVRRADLAEQLDIGTT
jgi:AcrR family transcriptional regulator